MNGRKAVAVYLMMLMAHIAHVFEEVWGEFRAIDVMGNLGIFLIANWLLIGLVVLLFWLILSGRRWAFFAGMVYGAIMMLNGFGHCILVVVTAEYYGGYAGCFTGILLIILGPFLVYHLRKEMPEG